MLVKVILFQKSKIRILSGKKKPEWFADPYDNFMKPYIAVADEIKVREMAKFNASDIRIS